MLVKIILALAIACMFMGGIGAAGGITGLKTAIADKQIVSNSAMLDKSISCKPMIASISLLNDSGSS